MQRKPSTKQANQNISLTPTKKGPGRRHAAVKHGAAPVAAKGAFLGQHTNPERRAKRELMQKCGGRRQYLRALKSAYRAAA